MVNNTLKKKAFLESFLIAFIILILGIGVEILMRGKPVEMPAFPYNLILILIFLFYPFLAKWLFGKKIVEKLSSIPITIASITIYTGLVITMGSFLQDNPQPSYWEKWLGLNHIAQTWYFLFISILMMTVLGFTIIKRLHHLKKIRNIIFLLNHLGIWIVIAAASLGSGDLQRVKLVVAPDAPNYLGLKTTDNSIVKLPFSIQLDSFFIEEYSPAIAFVDPFTKKIIKEISDYKENTSFRLNDWDITVLKVYKKSILKDSIYIPSTQEGAQHSVLLDIKKKNHHFRAWLGAPEMDKKGNMINLTMHEGIALLPAEIKQFYSKITIWGTQKNPIHADVSVNHPYHYANWDIYQLDYDQKAGRWSKYSVLELVYDPWLFLVYAGIIMLLIGSTLLLWFGKIK